MSNIIKDRELLVELYRLGMISSKYIVYLDIYDKIRSIPGKLSNRVKLVAPNMSVCKGTVYRALRFHKYSSE